MRQKKKSRREWLTLLLTAAFLLTAMFLLSGCASLLERQYSSVEPHSRKFWESEAAGTLRAETYSDIVNDLLFLVGQHRENAILRLYHFDGEGGSALDRAAIEVQQETPLGAYAVIYIASSTQSQRGYDEANIQISYRRTAEQIQAIVSATSPEAVYSLLEAALQEGRTELAVRVGYWTKNGREQVEQDVERLRADLGLADTPPWVVNYYPENGQVGLIEFDLHPPVQEGTPPERQEELSPEEQEETPQEETPPEGQEELSPEGQEESPPEGQERTGTDVQIEGQAE